MSIPVVTSPFYAIRSQVISRFADPTQGWAATYAETVAGGQYPTAPATMTPDFTSLLTPGQRSISVFEGRLRLETLLQGGITKYPLFVLYGKAARNTNLQKFQTFAGPVSFGIDVYLSYLSERLNSVYEDWPDAVEATMLSMVQLPTGQRQNWDSRTVYNGDLNWTRGEVVKGAGSYVQPITFTMTFDVIL